MDSRGLPASGNDKSFAGSAAQVFSDSRQPFFIKIMLGIAPEPGGIETQALLFELQSQGCRKCTDLAGLQAQAMVCHAAGDRKYRLDDVQATHRIVLRGDAA